MGEKVPKVDSVQVSLKAINLFAKKLIFIDKIFMLSNLISLPVFPRLLPLECLK
jgi:hypothetical protein